jgi:hypothetical protein
VSAAVYNEKYVEIFARYCLVIALSLIAGCVSNHYPYPASSNFDERLVGIGYAVINVQPGSSAEEKRLMAIKASKLEAYKSLAEQIYGQYLESRGTLSNQKFSDEEITSRVEGLIVGARVLSIKPISNDSYETVLEIGRSDAINHLVMRSDTEEAWSVNQGSE